jgi:uncharacterized protein (DUF1697 family)
VNVGGRVVKMDELRRLFEAAGLDDAETFIASGNVVFSTKVTSTAAVEQRVEAALAKALGYEVPTFIRTTAEVAEAAARTPFSEKDVAASGAYMAAMLKRPLDAAGKKGLAALTSAADQFIAHGSVVYWLSTLRQSETKLTLVKFERAVGCPATMRSMTSLSKLAARHCS